jgi:hypothetical protein
MPLAARLLWESRLVPLQSTNMETKIQREWCPGEGQEIPTDQVETAWG